MEKKEKNTTIAPVKNLEWGSHNPKLTDNNFIDSKRKKISDQNELLASSNAPITVPKEESGRDRKGVKEGENPLDLEDKRGEAF